MPDRSGEPCVADSSGTSLGLPSALGSGVFTPGAVPGKLKRGVAEYRKRRRETRDTWSSKLRQGVSVPFVVQEQELADPRAPKLNGVPASPRV